MSRVAKRGVSVPQGIDVKLGDAFIVVKGKSEELRIPAHPAVRVEADGASLTFTPVNDSREANALSGTMCQNVQNAVHGLERGFEKRLSLQGVGFRAQAQGAKLNLTIGFSHPVMVEMRSGLTVETPTPTEIVIKGANRQDVGQMAAEIRALRPPEPYKGKGIRYANEQIKLKETKKK